MTRVSRETQRDLVAPRLVSTTRYLRIRSDSSSHRVRLGLGPVRLSAVYDGSVLGDTQCTLPTGCPVPGPCVVDDRCHRLPPPTFLPVVQTSLSTAHEVVGTGRDERQRPLCRGVKGRVRTPIRTGTTPRTSSTLRSRPSLPGYGDETSGVWRGRRSVRRSTHGTKPPWVDLSGSGTLVSSGKEDTRKVGTGVVTRGDRD